MIPENVMMIDVESSNVRRIGYDEDAMVLYITFYNRNGVESIYWYAGVDQGMWESFFAAPSKGQFVWQYLRGHYEYARLS